MSLPGQPMMPPLIIRGARATEIIEQVVKERLKMIKPGLEMAYPDGMFPGQKKLPGKQRLIRYLMVTDPADLPYLEDSKYFDKYRAGVLPPLRSNYWKNVLALGREAFNELISDFSRQYRRAIENDEASDSDAQDD